MCKWADTMEQNKHIPEPFRSILLNPFPNTLFWDLPKFKEAADNNWNVAIKGF